MSRRNRESLENLSGLQELDRLVVEVIRALQSRSRHDDRLAQEDNVIYHEQWGEADYVDEAEALEADERRSRARPKDTAPRSPLETSDWEEGAEVPITEDWSEPLPEEMEAVADSEHPATATDAEHSVLSQAETAFIERTCRWLERRPHRDIILDQIWRNLLPKDSIEASVEDVEAVEDVKDVTDQEAVADDSDEGESDAD